MCHCPRERAIYQQRHSSSMGQHLGRASRCGTRVYWVDAQATEYWCGVELHAHSLLDKAFLIVPLSKGVCRTWRSLEGFHELCEEVDKRTPKLELLEAYIKCQQAFAWLGAQKGVVLTLPCIFGSWLGCFAWACSELWPDESPSPIDWQWTYIHCKRIVRCYNSGS